MDMVSRGIFMKHNLDKILLNDKGKGARTNHSLRCDKGSYVVRYRTHLYEERLKRWKRNYEIMRRGSVK